MDVSISICGADSPGYTASAGPVLVWMYPASLLLPLDYPAFNVDQRREYCGAGRWIRATVGNGSSSSKQYLRLSSYVLVEGRILRLHGTQKDSILNQRYPASTIRLAAQALTLSWSREQDTSCIM